MSFNCRTDCDLQSVAIPTQNRNERLYFNFTDPIDTCVKPKFDSYIDTMQDTNLKLDIQVESRRRNKDLLNCPDALCTDRGVVSFNATALEKLVPPAEPTDPVNYNGVLYPIKALTADYGLGGVFTGNLHLPTAGKYRVIMKFSGENTATPANYDQYVNDFTSEGGLTEVNISAVFSEVPSAMGGTGWDKTVNQSYVLIQVVALDEDAEIETEVSLGNLQVFDSIAEFAKNNTGWLTCVDTIDFNPTIDATDPDCVEQTLDPDTLDASMTLTVKKFSPNFLDASPLAKLDLDETKAGSIANACGVVTDNLLLLPNFTDIECGFIGAQAGACNADDGYLKYSTLHTANLPTGDYFRIVQDENGLYYAQFPTEYNGSEVTVIYPVLAGVETYKIVVDGKRIRPVRLRVPYRMNGSFDWELELHGFFNNIPLGWSATETTAFEITFTPTIKNGSIGKLRKITDPRVTNVSIL